jgi:hypothetical protein
MALHRRRTTELRRCGKQRAISRHVPPHGGTFGRREYDITEDENGEECCRLREWYPHDGPQRSIRTYKNKEQHGRQQIWRENGLQEYEANYDHGRKHGRQQAWDEDGQPQYDVNYDHDVYHGRQRLWWDDSGQLRQDTNNEHGKWHGLVRVWDKEGKLMQDDWYEHGKWWDRAGARRSLLPQEDIMIAVLLVEVASYI